MNWVTKQIKCISILFLILGFSTVVFSQIAPEKYWIQFADKANSPYSVDTPLVYLSQRAMDRRIAQGIAVTMQDLPVNPSYVSGVEQAASLVVINRSKWLNGVIIQTTDTVGLAAVLSLPFVDSVNSYSIENPNIPGPTSKKLEVKEMPNSRKKESAFSTTSIDYGLATVQNRMLDIPYVHDLGFTGNGMVIAILDAGFKGADTTEVLLPIFNNGQILGTWDFVLNQPIDYTNFSSHGKFVLNCMGANEPGRYVGTAPDASYWLLRTEDAPTENIIEEYNWVIGAEFADSAGADVFNTSLGYTTFDDSTYDHTYADLDGNTTVITRGADIAASKGILVVNSAGNSGGGSWHYIGAPADGDSVLAIGAVYDNRVVTGFSSRGPSADGRVKPNVMAMGGGVPMPIGLDSAISISGTSFSGPILAGAAACLWQSRTSYSNMEVYHAIEASAHLATNPNDDYGYGIPNMGMAYYLITGVEDLRTEGLNIKAYPNPTSGFVYIPMISNSVESIVVFDFLGRAVLSNSNPAVVDNSFQIDLSAHPKGIYFVHARTHEGAQIIRVVKE